MFEKNYYSLSVAVEIFASRAKLEWQTARIIVTVAMATSNPRGYFFFDSK